MSGTSLGPVGITPCSGFYAPTALDLYYFNMSDPLYRPRDYLMYPRLFGMADDPEMARTVSMIERARSKASWVQAGHAYRTRVLIAKHGVTRKLVAAEVEMSYQRLSRLLNGEIVMRLEDAARLQLYFQDRVNEG